MAQHGIALMQFCSPAAQLIRADARSLGNFVHVRICVRQEFVERWVEQSDRGWPIFQNAEDFLEIAPLHRQEFVERSATATLAIRKDHRPHFGDTLFFKEHVLSAAEANAFGAKFNRRTRIQRRFSIGAHFQRAHLVSPAHQQTEITRQIRLAHFDGAHHHLTGRPVHSDHVAFLDFTAHHAEHARLGIDLQATGAADTRPAHATGHNGGVAGHAAACRNNGAGSMHALDVFRAGLDAHEDHVLALFSHGPGIF